MDNFDRGLMLERPGGPGENADPHVLEALQVVEFGYLFKSPTRVVEWVVMADTGVVMVWENKKFWCYFVPLAISWEQFSTFLRLVSVREGNKEVRIDCGYPIRLTHDSMLAILGSRWAQQFNEEFGPAVQLSDGSTNKNELGRENIAFAN